MPFIVNAAIAFLGGAAYESTCVYWVHYSERGRPALTAVFSMAAAAAQVAGIGTSIHDMWCAPFFVAGYGAGTFAAVAFKSGESGGRDGG